MPDLVAYFRLSPGGRERSTRGGTDALGLGDQRHTYEQYRKACGGKTVAEYAEHESGRKHASKRPELAKAIAHARRAGAELVVAKLDRLARNVAFLSALMESGLDIRFLDFPDANKLVIHIMAAVAEDEAERIGNRIRGALREAKRRGTKLGSARPGHWKGREKARLAGLEKARRVSMEARRTASRIAYADLAPEIISRRNEGQSLTTIADWLNAEGQTTVRGKHFKPSTVARIIKRFAA